MKTLRFIYLLICAFVLQGLADKSQAQEMIPGYDDFPVLIDEEHFPDPVFRTVIEMADIDEDGLLSKEECASMRACDLSSMGIANLEGIRYLFALDTLDCSFNHLSSLDISGSPNLKVLFCQGNGLTELNIEDADNLNALYCYSNALEQLDLRTNLRLKTLSCEWNQLTELNLDRLDSLTDFYCTGNRLGHLNLSGLIMLKDFDCSGNQLESLDLNGNDSLIVASASENPFSTVNLSGCSSLQDFYCLNNDSLERVDLEGTINLETLVCANNPKLRELDVNSINLIELYCYGNDLEVLQTAGLPALRTIDCAENDLFRIDLSDNRYLQQISCQNNRLVGLHLASSNYYLRGVNCSMNRLQDLSLGFCWNLYSVACDSNQLTSLDVSGCQVLASLSCKGNHRFVPVDDNRDFILGQLPDFDEDKVISWMGGSLHGDTLHFDQERLFYNYLVKEDTVQFSLTMVPRVKIDSIAFPDTAFRDYVASRLDVDGDGYLVLSERESISSLDVSHRGLRSLIGIEYFGWLEYLDFSHNEITSVDLSANTLLDEIVAEGNALEVVVDDDWGFNLASLPDLRADKVYDLQDAWIKDSILFFEKDSVSYAYQYSYQGKASLPEVRFTLFSNLPVRILVDAGHFPDTIFRSYVRKNIDLSGNGFLNEEEIAEVRDLDVSGLGIKDLRGIECFTELESLDCSDNELTSLDLFENKLLMDLEARNNRLDIVLDEGDAFDMSTLPGFDRHYASDWEGADMDGDILIFTQQEVTYSYDTRYRGDSEDEGLKSVEFTLVADRDPSEGSEPDPDPTTSEEIDGSRARVYACGHVVYVEGIEDEISIYNIAGILYYQGFDSEIPMQNTGVYIVRSGQQIWKVLVM